jgi:hypothetical protein
MVSLSESKPTDARLPSTIRPTLSSNAALQLTHFTRATAVAPMYNATSWWEGAHPHFMHASTIHRKSSSPMLPLMTLIRYASVAEAIAA